MGLEKRERSALFRWLLTNSQTQSCSGSSWGGKAGGGAWFWVVGCNGFVMMMTMCGFDFGLMRRVLAFFFLFALPLFSLSPIQRDLYNVCKAESKYGDARFGIGRRTCRGTRYC